MPAFLSGVLVHPAASSKVQIVKSFAFMLILFCIVFLGITLYLFFSAPALPPESAIEVSDGKVTLYLDMLYFFDVDNAKLYMTGN